MPSDGPYKSLYDAAVDTLTPYKEQDGVGDHIEWPPKLDGRPRRFEDLDFDDPYKERLVDVGTWLPEEEAEEYYQACLFCDWVERQSSDAFDWLQPQYKAAKDDIRHFESVSMTIKGIVYKAEAMAKRNDMRAVGELAKDAKDKYKRRWPASRWKRLTTLANSTIRKWRTMKEA